MQTPSIVIIGLGPKGLFCFERLLAELKASPKEMQIHLINRTNLFGVSPIYDISQPDYILLNNSVGDINIWTQNSPAAHR